MRYAVIENGKVVNVVDAEPEFAEEMGWVLCVDCRIGDEWNGSEFSPSQDILPAPKPSRLDSVISLLVEKKYFTEDEASKLK